MTPTAQGKPVVKRTELTPGYAYRFTGKRRWLSSSSECWETVMLAIPSVQCSACEGSGQVEDEHGNYDGVKCLECEGTGASAVRIGQRQIDGHTVQVFCAHDGTIYAQFGFGAARGPAAR